MEIPFPEPFVLSLMTLLGSEGQRVLRFVSKRYDQAYRQYWLIQAKQRLGRILDRREQPIDTKPRFRMALYQCFSPAGERNIPLLPFTPEGFRSGPGIRPLVSQCMQHAGQIGDQTTIDQLRNEGVDTLAAIFGISMELARHPGNQLHFALLQKLLIDAPTEAPRWSAKGFIAGGSLTGALGTKVPPSPEWIVTAIRYGRLNLVEPTLSFIELTWNPKRKSSIFRRSDDQFYRWYEEVERLTGGILAHHGYFEMARKYGREGTPLERIVHSGDCVKFVDELERLGVHMNWESLVHILVDNDAFHLLPCLYIFMDINSLPHEPIDVRLLIKILRTRKYDLLSSISPLSKSIRLWPPLKDAIVQSYDRDIIEWYLDPSGYENPEDRERQLTSILEDLKRDGHMELYNYFSR